MGARGGMVATQARASGGALAGMEAAAGRLLSSCCCARFRLSDPARFHKKPAKRRAPTAAVQIQYPRHCPRALPEQSIQTAMGGPACISAGRHGSVYVYTCIPRTQILNHEA